MATHPDLDRANGNVSELEANRRLREFADMGARLHPNDPWFRYYRALGSISSEEHLAPELFERTLDDLIFVSEKLPHEFAPRFLEAQLRAVGNDTRGAQIIWRELLSALPHKRRRSSHLRLPPTLNSEALEPLIRASASESGAALSAPRGRAGFEAESRNWHDEVDKIGTGSVKKLLQTVTAIEPNRLFALETTVASRPVRRRPRASRQWFSRTSTSGYLLRWVALIASIGVAVAVLSNTFSFFGPLLLVIGLCTTVVAAALLGLDELPKRPWRISELANLKEEKVTEEHLLGMTIYDRICHELVEAEIVSSGEGSAWDRARWAFWPPSYRSRRRIHQRAALLAELHEVVEREFGGWGDDDELFFDRARENRGAVGVAHMGRLRNNPEWTTSDITRLRELLDGTTQVASEPQSSIE